MPEIVLQTRGITKHYGPLTAVSNLDLEVHQGEIFGFLGPNGAGKTTSINMLCGLLKPDCGEVFIHGEILNNDPNIRQRVGVCPQNIILWNSLTCIEQLIFIGEMYNVAHPLARSRGELLLEMMGLADKRNKLAKTLSGGMQRRLNLIMALVHEPEILVLDEPEAGLDPQSRVLVRDFIKSLAHSKTIILTTHNMDEADRMVDRVAIIDHGQLLAVDTPTALKESVGLGDVLEFSIEDAEKIERVVSALKTITPDLSMSGKEIILRGRGLVEKLPVMIKTMQELECKPEDIRLRQNSLEDVFLTFTGRRLRE